MSQSDTALHCSSIIIYLFESMHCNDDLTKRGWCRRCWNCAPLSLSLQHRLGQTRDSAFVHSTVTQVHCGRENHIPRVHHELIALADIHYRGNSQQPTKEDSVNQSARKDTASHTYRHAPPPIHIHSSINHHVQSRQQPTRAQA